MEKVEIDRFLSTEIVDNYSHRDGSGYGSGDGFGYGLSNGSGDGSGNGSGYGLSNGSGYGLGDGSDYISDYGSGNDSGYGSDYGSGDGYGYGNGYGNCDGCGRSGFNWGNVDDSIKKINNQQVISIDNVQTIIENVHGNYAKGYILRDDLTTTPCFIAKCGNYFAHGKTLAEAREYAQAKYEKRLPVEKRIELFNKKYPSNDVPIDGNELFDYHNKLTGSCLFGRLSFCKERGLDLNSKYTVREFISITEDAYGGEIIMKLKESRGL